MPHGFSTPPSVFDVIPQQWAAVVDAFEKLVPGDRYSHWVDICSKPAPAGISREAWWVALKLARSGGRRTTALKDGRGIPFEFNVAADVAEILHDIDRNAEGLLVDRQLADRFSASALLAETIASAQLAGATTPRGAAREMLRAGRPPEDRNESTIWDLHGALQEVRRLREQPLSVDMILVLHRSISVGTAPPPESAGRPRGEGNKGTIVDAQGQVVHQPPPAEELNGRLESMCQFANARTSAPFIHPVVRAIILHFWVAHDRPFADGNGRLARALSLWALLHAGYAVFDYLCPSALLLLAPKRYDLAFRQTETDDNDLTYFILHELEVVRAAIQTLRDRMTRKTGEMKQASGRVPDFEDLNPRQQALIAHALRQPGARYGIARHQHSHGVTHQTARDDLFNLVHRGLLEARRERRVYVFQATSELGRPALPRRRVSVEEHSFNDQLPTALL